MIKIISVLVIALITSSAFAEDVKKRRAVANHLQDISVTVKAENEYNRSEGSGVLVVRKIGGEDVTFVWTAAHVVDNLRSVRSVVGEKGTSRKIIEFKDAQIVKELVERGRRVGEVKMDAEVIKYSDYEHGHDLALLMVRAKNYGKASALFYLDKDEPIIPIGTSLFHVGSLLGQMGANSMTSGIIAQVGRTLGKVEFDQTTVTAFPGSSGGGVFLTDGRYVGMLVRGAGEGFNFIVPIRRMQKWANSSGVSWALNPDVEAPSMKEIGKMLVEDSGIEGEGDDEGHSAISKFPFLIVRERLNGSEPTSTLNR